jgi:plastocyanin
MRYLALLTLVLAGCRGPSEPQPRAYFKVDPANAGAINGTVRFTGPKPAPRRISMDAEEACEKMQTGPVYSGAVETGSEAGLANAFVYVKSGLEGKVFEPAGQAVVLDQRGCQFVPRVVPLRAGQTLQVKNSDPVSHNIHPQPANNYEWNQQQSPGAPDLRRKFVRPEVMIPVKCNIHAWMKSYIAVLDHPYFAVTDSSGRFGWKDLPPGEYVIAAWHETLGEQTQKVSVARAGTVAADFTFTTGTSAR